MKHIPRYMNPFEFILALACLFVTESAIGAEPDLRLDVSGHRDTISIYGPLILQVTLINIGEDEFEVLVRVDGAPYSLATLIRNESELYAEDKHWLRRSGPQKHLVALAPGESTSGEVIVFLGKNETGFAFPNDGMYSLQLRFLAEDTEITVDSNEFELVVATESDDHRSLIDALNDIGIEYYGYESEVLAHRPAEDRTASAHLLREIVRQSKPLRLDPITRASDERHVMLADKLEQLIEEYPDSSYAGYFARYLGLIQMEDLERTRGMSKADPSQIKEQPAFKKAEQFLSLAEKTRLWPRYVATQRLGQLYIMAQDWAAAEECCERLETDANAKTLAAELRREAQRYRLKTQRQREARSPAPSDGRSSG